MQLAHGAGVAVRKDRLRSFGAMASGLDGLGDSAYGLVPADGTESAGTLGAITQQRGGESARMIRALEVLADLGAKKPLGEGVVRIATQTSGDAVRDRHEHTAGVRTVVGAHAPDRARASEWQ